MSLLKEVAILLLLLLFVRGKVRLGDEQLIHENITLKDSAADASPLTDVEVQTIITNSQEQFSAQPATSFTSGSPPAGPTIEVDDTVHYQTIQGFGAALTDSSAYLLHNLPKDLYWSTLNSLFNATSGIGISYIRLSISVCDFSLSNYTYDNMPPGDTDINLEHFSIDYDKQYIIPVLRDILKINPGLKILASPWSPPAWMKSTDTLVGSVNDTNSILMTEYYPTYANFFVRVIEAYQKEGITIDTLTVQNEPLYGTTTYPGMYMDSQSQSDFINNYLAEAFIANGIQTKVFVFDHNWSDEDYPAYVIQKLNAESTKIVGGAAFHCYFGNVTNQTTFHDSFPDWPIYLTECSGGISDTEIFSNVLISDMQRLFIGAVNNWAEVSIKWNLALDQNRGPQNNGCQQCRGIILINTTNNEVTNNVDYYTVGTFSKFVPHGSVRIQVSSNDDNLIATGFNTPDGSRVVIVLNQGNSDETISLSWNGSWVQSVIPEETVAVYKW